MRTKVEPGRVGFTEGLASEWAKFRTVRSTRWTLAAMAAFVLGIAVFVGATRSLQPEDTVLGGSLTGATFGLLVGASFGVLVISREYATGTIGATLMACPRRGVVLAAKATVTAAVMFGVALAACFSVTALGGLAVGAVLRHPAGAITTMVTVLLLPSLIGPLLGGWERWVAGASPVAAMQKLSQSSDAAPDAVGSLGAWPSLWLVFGYVLVALVGAGLVFRRRDA